MVRSAGANRRGRPMCACSYRRTISPYDFEKSGAGLIPLEVLPHRCQSARQRSYPRFLVHSTGIEATKIPI
jgi:hypothetical protein